MLRSCCACAKVTPRHKTVTKTLRCVLPAELGMTRKPHKRYETRAIDGQRTGTARPFPLWRLPSGPYHRPSIQIFGVGADVRNLFFVHHVPSNSEHEKDSDDGP